jgi:hypothetical protein
VYKNGSNIIDPSALPIFYNIFNVIENLTCRRRCIAESRNGRKLVFLLKAQTSSERSKLKDRTNVAVKMSSTAQCARPRSL